MMKLSLVLAVFSFVGIMLWDEIAGILGWIGKLFKKKKKKDIIENDGTLSYWLVKGTKEAFRKMEEESKK